MSRHNNIGTSQRFRYVTQGTGSQSTHGSIHGTWAPFLRLEFSSQDYVTGTPCLLFLALICSGIVTQAQWRLCIPFVPRPLNIHQGLSQSRGSCAVLVQHTTSTKVQHVKRGDRSRTIKSEKRKKKKRKGNNSTHLNAEADCPTWHDQDTLPFPLPPPPPTPPSPPHRAPSRPASPRVISCGHAAMRPIEWRVGRKQV